MSTRTQYVCDSCAEVMTTPAVCIIAGKPTSTANDVFNVLVNGRSVTQTDRLDFCSSGCLQQYVKILSTK